MDSPHRAAALRQVDGEPVQRLALSSFAVMRLTAPDTTTAGDVRAELPLASPLHLPRTLGPLSRGVQDRTTAVVDGRLAWRATRTPQGPACVRYLLTAPDTLCVDAWGPGAAWASEHAPTLLGATDDPTALVPQHAVVAELLRRLPGLRITRSEAVVEAMIPLVIEQKVAGVLAWRSYGRLVEALDEPAPGPAPLLLPPSPLRLAHLPYWVLHRCGVERRRADVLRQLCHAAGRLEEAVEMPPAAARDRLTALPGIGAWTAAEVALVALGDADAVSVGDYHLPHLVAWALAGEARGDDARMLELLEPYRGQRGRVIRLLVAGGLAAPRFGPRQRLHDIAGR